MSEEERTVFERVAAGVPFDGPQATQDWLTTLTPEQRDIAEALYRRIAQRARENELI